MVCNGLMIKDYDSVKLWPERKLWKWCWAHSRTKVYLILVNPIWEGFRLMSKCDIWLEKKCSRCIACSSVTSTTIFVLLRYCEGGRKYYILRRISDVDN